MKQAKPDNTPWISPYITVLDADKSAEFYKNAFHFEIKELSEGDDGTTWHAELNYKGQLIMLGKQGVYGGVTETPITSGIASPINLYLYTENVDELYQHAIAHQAQGVIPPEDMFWGDRMCQLKDLDGYIWCFATRI